MQARTAMECDSMDSEELETIQRMILQREGPTLGQVYSPKVPKLFTTISSAGFIKALPDRGGKEVSYIGNSEEAAFRAFYYLLLHIELEEKRSYPHLRNIIQQQLNKENIIRRQQQEVNQKSKEKKQRKKEKRDSRDNICDMYFQLVNQWGRIEDFILRNQKFDSICLNMIQNLIYSKDKFFPVHENDEKAAESREKDTDPCKDKSSDTRKQSKKTQAAERNIGEQYQFLCRVFNIDLELFSQGNSSFSAYRMGSTRRFFIISEAGHIFAVLLGLQLSNSGRDYSNHESELMSNASTPLLPQVLEASDISTPKFIEGHESSIRYRKKSHKNSFGGDMDILSYKDLGSSLHQFQDNKKARQKLQKYIESQKKKPEKVFSERFETQEMGELQEIDQEDSKKQKTRKGNWAQEVEEFVERLPKKNNVTHRTMRKSHCETKAANFQSFLDRGIKLQQSNNFLINSSRKKRMSSSACLEQQQAEKLATFNNKISFSKHDRNKFVMNRDREEAPEREASDTMSSAHYESIALHNNVANIKSNLINTYAYPQSKAMQIVMMGNHKRMIDSKIVELPLEEIERSNWSDEHDQALQGNVGPHANDRIQYTEPPSQVINQILHKQFREKLQTRKFSYIPEKIDTSPNNKNRTYLLNKSANQVGLIGSPQHRQPPIQQQRFHENLLSLNQLDRSTSSIPMGSPTRAIQKFSSHPRNGNRLQLARKVVSYCSNQEKQVQPEGWIRKEITYFFNSKPAETRGYLPPQKKEMPFNISLTKSTDRSFRPYDNSLKQMKKSDNIEGREIIYEKESYLEGPSLTHKESTAQQNVSNGNRLHLRNGSYNPTASPNRLEREKRASIYSPMVSPSNAKQIAEINQNRKHSVSYSVYSRKVAFQDHSHTNQQKQSYHMQSPHYSNALLQTSLSGRVIRQDSPQGSQGNKSGRNEENTQKQEHTAKVRQSIKNNGKGNINYFSKNISRTINNNSNNSNANASNNIQGRIPGNSNSNTKYRPFFPNQVTSPNKLAYSPIYPSHGQNSSFASHTPTHSNQHANAGNNSVTSTHTPFTVVSGFLENMSHGTGDGINMQQGQLRTAGTPVSSTNKGMQSPFHMTANGPFSPTNYMYSHDPNDPHGPDLPYSTSTEHLILSSPKNSPNITPNHDERRERMEKVLEQSKHHRASFNFVLIQGRDVNRDSPNHSNSGMAVMNGNNGMSQAMGMNGYRPPSNTGTVSSRANTNANSCGTRPNTDFLYYRM